MRGVSKASQIAGQEQVEALLRAGSVDPAALAEDLFGVTGALASSAGLRRALTDPSRDGEAKAGLVAQLFGGKISGSAIDLVSGLVRGRWSAGGDLTDTVEALAVSAVLAGAERAGRLESVEDELFRFGRTVGGDQGLRDAFSARTEGSARKGDLVRALLGGRAAPETVRLAVQAASHPRGLRTERALEAYVDAAAARRRQLVAEVVVALPLTETQRDRLGAALQQIYGRAVRLNVDIDPSVVGGIRVQIAGEVLDGTVAGRLADAQRRLAG
ncbi:MAG: F0F1 ATP synthase subunit delta [Kineosporiaceae bacterium]|nr:F0F1 ATP synthase subunit delta [Kineosporiaceae bacterium]MBK8078357.1 F0F1 ATP synthase subunit delta [Kineosporiaceae bacterium]